MADIHEHELSATDESHAFRSHAFQAAGLTKVVQEFGALLQCAVRDCSVDFGALVQLSLANPFVNATCVVKLTDGA